jgi:putative methionine-R-sulfoxide reductase with GAF domain
MTENEDYYGDAASSSAEIDLLLRNVSKLPNVAFFVWNEDSGKPIYISRQLPKFYRMSMADFLEAFGTNEKISANMVGEDGERYLAATRAGMEAASSYEVEFRFYRADGTICFAREVGEYLRDSNANRVLRSVGAVIDITTQKETEQALRRLSSELQESLEYQTATSEILKVISRSAFDLDTVLTSLIRSAIQLCDATRGVIWLRKGEQLFLAAQVGYSEEWIAAVRDSPITPAADAVTTSGLAAFTGEVVHVEDVPNDPRFRSLAAHKLGDYKAGLAVPLMRDGKVEGVISLSRPEARLFTERQVALVQSFADQAVIAIENVRLFDEVQERTAELGEALQQQTATADVLKAISRSTFDLQPVLDTLVESAARLCDANKGVIFKREGDAYRW